MSAWERARNIPWERIPQDGSNIEGQKELILRELQREAVEDELRSQDRHTHRLAPSTEEGVDVKLEIAKHRIPYSNMELLRQAAFGATVGSITGAVFGFMDSMRAAGDSQVLAKTSNTAKGRFILQGTTRSATVFGVFFGGFQIVKYGFRVVLDPGEIPEIIGAGAISMGALMYKPAFRASMPYAAMLVVMDGANLYMRKSSS
jgi:hypothetical protein